jgi:copper transport protein
MRAAIRGLVLLMAVAVLLAGGPSRAGAHALLLSSYPAHGGALSKAPAFVEVRFNEPVTAAFTPLTVRDSAGRQVDRGDGALEPNDPTLLTVTLPRDLPDGLYTAQYRVVSLDGHPVEGTLAFGVGVEAVPTDVAPPDGSTAVPPAVGLLHGLTQALAVLLAGLTAFVVLIWQRESGAGPGQRSLRLLALGLTGALLAVGVAELALFAVRASGEPFSSGLLAQAATATRAGQIGLGRLGTALLAGAALALAGRAAAGLLQRIALLLPGALLLLTLTLSSHAMATQDWRLIAADWIHLLVLAPWVGGVAGFALWAPPPPERQAWLGELVPRFSRIAIASIILAALTGAAGALHHLPSIESLWATAYGRSFTAKMALLLPVLALGALHLRGRGAGRFRLTVRLELAVLAGVFVAAGFLSSLPPAGVELAARQGPFEQTAAVDGLTMTLKVAPSRLGFNQPTVVLTLPGGQPAEGAAVVLRITMRGHDMGLQQLDATSPAPGVYTTEPAVLGMPGDWQVEVVVLTKQGQEVRHPFVISLPDPRG